MSVINTFNLLIYYNIIIINSYTTLNSVLSDSEGPGNEMSFNIISFWHNKREE